MTGEPEETNAGSDAENEAEAPETTEQNESGLQEDDFVRLAYTARTVEDGTLVDTTDEEVAQEEGVGEEETFEPRVIVLGSEHIFPGVEEDIIGKEVGDGGSVAIPAEEAFGEYDQEEVRTVSTEKIPEDDRYPGAQVQIDQQQGYLETIIGGRARVDFNHPLAGEDIEYEYEIVELVEDDLERAEGLMGMFFDIDLDMEIQTDEVEEQQPVESEDEDEEAEPEMETVTVEKESLYIESTPQLAMNQQWMFQKQQIAQQLIGQTGIDRVVVQEIIDDSPMGGMGMPGMMGGAGGGDIEEALDDVDVDADEIVEEIEGEELDESAE
ncbi:FKBP-type peptidyl-prolyl cis-trans isomerase [Halocatena pleomorpha]|uniref:peptidylprolyl isomerase n=1 Tax=Halocatena pleomorpha TaxID=1785090 RepID=A0A3P3RIU9_9EURY|nr:peptidylprolyl isomerase [Halocatena pleomorpha]RRJ33466.1 peptidylprolyl isomerase [Halocatena pleomorpha]